MTVQVIRRPILFLRSIGGASEECLADNASDVDEEGARLSEELVEGPRVGDASRKRYRAVSSLALGEARRGAVRQGVGEDGGVNIGGCRQRYELAWKSCECCDPKESGSKGA